MDGKGGRWWLPGPPPPRRLISLASVEESYLKDGTPALDIPIRHVKVSQPSLQKTLDSYVDQSKNPITSPGTMVLFHGCGNTISPDIVRSFARRGPSIRYSRDRGYLSTKPAVYWTNSINFAISWCVFSKTGAWQFNDMKGDNTSFTCLLYISRLNLSKTFPQGIYMVPPPQNPEDEDELSGALYFH